MEIKELRIGNIIKTDMSYLPYWSIKEDDMRFILEAKDRSIYMPVELTEAWLERFGFEKSFGEFNKGWFTLMELRGIFKFRSNDGNLNQIKVEYVHKLQNLYYALTGEELTVKL